MRSYRRWSTFWHIQVYHAYPNLSMPDEAGHGVTRYTKYSAPGGKSPSFPEGGLQTPCLPDPRLRGTFPRPGSPARPLGGARELMPSYALRIPLPLQGRCTILLLTRSAAAPCIPSLTGGNISTQGSLLVPSCPGGQEGTRSNIIVPRLALAWRLPKAAVSSQPLRGSLRALARRTII